MKFPIAWPSGLIEYVNMERSQDDVVITMPLGLQTARISRSQLERFLGREVPNVGATDQPTRTTTTNIEPSAASAKPSESS